MHSHAPVDAAAFGADLDALTGRVRADRQPGDLAHLVRIERAGRALALLGYATAWIAVNPVSVAGIALGLSARWMIVAHHVLHRGYDAYAGVPARHKSAVFGRGARRLLDWCDWIPVAAWMREHNVLHHYRLGEPHDPDVPEANLGWLARARLPMLVKWLLLLLMALTWKWGYYGPSVVQAAKRRGNDEPRPFDPADGALWNPLHPLGRQVWVESRLPYLAVRFGVMPLFFLPLGRAAWLAVLLNTALAELLTNLHSFLLVVPNHAGSDVPRFTKPAVDKREHRLRQIVGSVNYRTGGDVNDFLHGWLNYQIEHHVWPDLSLRQYQRWQPELRALCERHGVRYLQEPLWRRVVAMVRNVTGATRMPELESLAQRASWSRSSVQIS